jgi:protein-disulfide isomerase
MASRAEQKAAARAAREARQKQVSAAHARRARLIWLGGLMSVVVVAIVIVIVLGGGSNARPEGSRTSRAEVIALLKSIPEHDNVLGQPTAPVTITEFGDLACPACQAFALSSEQQLISHDVRDGTVKLVYRGMETASQDANAGEYTAGQIAARAAGLQNREWYYVLLWYHEQQSEDTPYVTDAFMQGLATQVPGLNLARWEADRDDPALARDVTKDTQTANADGFDATPSLTFTGPKGPAQPISAVPTYAGLTAAIKAVQ